MNLRLIRDDKGADYTLGTLSIWTPQEDLLLNTMEPPWIPAGDPLCDRGGLKFKSCVPPGIYRLERHNTKKHPFTWALVNHELDVVHQPGDDNDPDEDREASLIHVANYARQLQACIAPGMGRAKDESGTWMVTHSRTAMLHIKRILPWTDDHTLEIM